MFETLKRLHEKPEPFSVYTTDVLWTGEYLSARMLELHLDPGVGLASRPPAVIDGTVGWLDRMLRLDGKAVCDLGCGPGLYAERMARRGARVTGIDFSRRSIEHARKAAAESGLDIRYRHADYLRDELPPGQDVFLLIFCDLCALSPERRRTLYGKIRRAAGRDARFVFDVPSLPQFDQRVEETRFGRRFMNGFWAPDDYFGYVTTFLYRDLKLALDRYLIVERDRSWEVFNWLQHFDVAAVTAELAGNGFAVDAVVDVATGDDWRSGPSEFAVVARPKP